ncbi:MAG: hypothetical protein JWM82_4241 [Myxococcales bacterium]|nr:hypothetical protein [Myxococcales bacterium]
MTFKINWVGAALGLMVLLDPTSARADRRAYATTYEAVTAPKGELDVEMWSSYARDGELLDGPPTKGFRNMLELEYGLTDRWDVALYNLLDVDTVSGDTGYGGLKLETRYRLLPAGSWIVDPIIYFEFQYLRHGDAREKGEVKLILARDLGPWNIAFNVAGEAEHLVVGDYIPEAEYALGVSRELAGPAVKLGYEIFGKAEKPPGENVEAFAWTGPALSWATRFHDARMQGLWATVGFGRGLTSHSETWYGRAIVGLQF